MLYFFTSNLLITDNTRPKKDKKNDDNDQLVRQKIVPIEPTNTKSQLRVGPFRRVGYVFVRHHRRMREPMEKLDVRESEA
jgi:hypothetical protein